MLCTVIGVKKVQTFDRVKLFCYYYIQFTTHEILDKTGAI